MFGISLKDLEGTVGMARVLSEMDDVKNRVPTILYDLLWHKNDFDVITLNFSLNVDGHERYGYNLRMYGYLDLSTLLQIRFDQKTIGG